MKEIQKLFKSYRVNGGASGGVRTGTKKQSYPRYTGVT